MLTYYYEGEGPRGEALLQDVIVGGGVAVEPGRFYSYKVSSLYKMEAVTVIYHIHFIELFRNLRIEFNGNIPGATFYPKVSRAGRPWCIWHVNIVLGCGRLDVLGCRHCRRLDILIDCRHCRRLHGPALTILWRTAESLGLTNFIALLNCQFMFP